MYEKRPAQVNLSAGASILNKDRMGKTLVIAEKPSVGRDLAGALADSFTASKDKTYIEGDNYVITWAIGHLVGLAEPDAYDAKLKKWRYADLPIVPKKFKLVPNDDKSKKQLSVIHRFLRSDDIDNVVNACDAGREGELIFAYVYETGKVKKPVKRLWLSSMTRAAIQEAFERLRDGEEMLPLEAAARSRSEADWIVGMNATRAASIRLRAAFDGAVSLGRVQTPTLALVARREVEIRNFKPEPYWLVEAKFEADAERRYDARYLGGKRIAEDLAAEIVEACRDKPGEITKLETKEERERSQLLYDLTSLQRHANTRYGFSARRTLAAAQKLYEQHKAITYPRTNSRWLSGDLVAEIRPTAELVGKNPQYAKGAAFVTSLKELPLGRVVNDKKVTDHHAIIPTRSEHNIKKMGEDEVKIYDLVAKRFLAIFHPEAVYERTRVETTVEEHVFRTSGRRLLEAGWKAVYGEEVGGRPAGRRRLGRRPVPAEARTGRDGPDAGGRVAAQGDPAAAALHRGVAPGRDGDGGQGHRGGRSARGHEGLGHRHAGDARRDHRAAAVRRVHRARRPRAARDREGCAGDRPARRAPAHVAAAHGRVGEAARADRRGRGEPAVVHERHRQVHRVDRAGARQAQGREDRAGEPRPVPGLRQGHHREPQGLLVLVEGRPRLRLRHLEEEGRQEPLGNGREGADRQPQGVDRARRRPARGPHREAGDRLPRALRPELPREAEGRAVDPRRRQPRLARRVRRGVGHAAARDSARRGRRER